MIAFNKPYLTGNEITYISKVLEQQISGNGFYTKECHSFFNNQYGFKKVLLTNSCTDALEMAAILLNIKTGDEVIIPSFTFVSTANAFLLRGAKIVFADSLPDNPNIDINKLSNLINGKTRAIVIVHYAGVSVDMGAVMSLAKKHNLFVIEDAAQAINAYFEERPLGGIGHMGCFSFHDTKNIISGEGGMLVINDDQFMNRAEVIWEKGTNRSAFIRGEVDKYGWVDIGSSFLPSELTAAFLYAQLENIDEIQKKRTNLWENYFNKLKFIETQSVVRLPKLPVFAKHNAHIFYMVCRDRDQRDKLIQFLKEAGIQANFHYPPLHLSKFNLQINDRQHLPEAQKFSEGIIRLPIYVDMSQNEQEYIIDKIESALRSEILS